ncbi:hypothetical protein [Haloferula sargassicola]
MRPLHVPFLLLLGALAHGASIQRASPVSDATLIADLASESYPVRVTATRELWERGKEVLPMLENAARSINPESAARARDLIRKIRIGLTTDSQPRLIGLIEAYDQASPAERRKIVTTIRRDGAYLPLLKLYALEGDEATLRAIAPEMQGVAIAAARQLMMNGKPEPEEVKKILELGRVEPDQLMALADFHRVHGSLEKELKRARANRRESGYLWRSYLLAAAGRPAEAAKEAEAGGYPEAAARWQLLAGDPVPWLVRAETPVHQIVPEALESYREAVRGLWEGKPVPQNLVSGLSDGVTGNLDDESWHTVAILYALGARQEGDEAYRKLTPTQAFVYFDNSERIDDALRLLSINPRKPDFAGWVGARFEKMIDDPDDSDVARDELKIIGSFMERRGLIDLTTELFVPGLIRLSDRDPEWYCELLAGFFMPDLEEGSGPITEAVLRAAATFAEGDEGRLSMIRASLLGEDPMAVETWSLIDRQMPAASLIDRLRLSATLLGKVPDSRGEAKGWWDRQLADLPEAGDRNDILRWTLMLRLTMAVPDARRFLEVDRICEQAGIKPGAGDELLEDVQLDGMRLQCYELTGQWEKVLESYRSHFESTPDSVLQLALIASACRKTGDLDEARRLERRMSELVLGESHLMVQIGTIYAREGELEIAREWRRRAAMMAVQDDAFIETCDDLDDEAKYEGDWKLSASIGEAVMFYAVMKGDMAFRDPAILLRGRAAIEVSRGLAEIDAGHREQGIAHLKRWEDVVYDDPAMADHFFAAFRKRGLQTLHDEWFGRAWKRYHSVLADYPDSVNTLNSAAWIAARACRKLDDAERSSSRAVQLDPDNWMYLDTQAEVWFARHDREQAVKWSDRSASKFNYITDVAELFRQNQRFHEGPFPPP